MEIAFHKTGSTKNLELVLSLFAHDVLLTAGGKTYTGKDQVRKFWQAGPFQPQNQWAGCTPAFRLGYDVKGARAHLYFECLWVDKAAKKDRGSYRFRRRPPPGQRPQADQGDEGRRRADVHGGAAA